MAVTVQSVALDGCDRGVHFSKQQQHTVASPQSNWPGYQEGAGRSEVKVMSLVAVLMAVMVSRWRLQGCSRTESRVEESTPEDWERSVDDTGDTTNSVHILHLQKTSERFVIVTREYSVLTGNEIEAV